MNKVFVLAPNEDWIVDRFVREWNEDNADISVSEMYQSDVVWLLADWAWNHLPGYELLNRKVITTVHHIVPEKFGTMQQQEFRQRDRYTTVYHVYNESTLEFIRPLTNKPIHYIPYWANQKIWRPTGEKQDLRKRHGLSPDAYLIGSFQRDTEGHDLISPKLEKGPDLLADAIITYRNRWNHHHAIEVVLGGWRRQYIMQRLGEAGIRYTYFERPQQHVINELYQALDLYPVTARTEGGPQSLIECGLLNVPVVSRPIGIASQVLPSVSIADDVTTAVPAVPNVESWKLPTGYEGYRKLIASL